MFVQMTLPWREDSLIGRWKEQIASEFGVKPDRVEIEKTGSKYKVGVWLPLDQFQTITHGRPMLCR